MGVGVREQACLKYLHKPWNQNRNPIHHEKNSAFDGILTGSPISKNENLQVSMITIRLAHWLHYIHPPHTLMHPSWASCPSRFAGISNYQSTWTKTTFTRLPIIPRQYLVFAVYCLFSEAERICAGDFGMDRVRMSQLCPEPLAPSRSPIPRKYHFQSPSQARVHLRSFWISYFLTGAR